MELKKYRLGDIAKVEISGIDKKSKEGQQDVLLCNFVDVYYNWAVTKDNESKFMPATASDSEIESFTLHKGQVAITKDSETRDDIGVATYIADDFDNLVVLGYHTALITPDEEQLCGKYLNALMHSSYFQRYWSNNASGSGQRYTLSQKVIEDAPVYLPDIDIQREIGEFFSDLDRKLCLNKKENEILEAMAKQLYDYWFIQFDFPDANGRPYKTSGGKMVWNETLKREIPEGWEVKNLPYIASFTNGLACQRFRPTGDDCGLPVIKISNMHGEKSNEKEFVKSDIPESVKVYDGDILFSWSASLEVIIWAYGIGGLNQHIFKVTEKNGYSKYFVYHKLLGYVDQFRRIAQARKTTMGHITSDHLNQSTIEIPDNEIIYKSFDKEVAPIYSRIISNSQEVIKLQGLKDFILPLLMTGQVTIE